MKKYHCTDGNAELEIQAESAEEAAQEYVDGGDWGDDGKGGSVEVRVWTRRECDWCDAEATAKIADDYVCDAHWKNAVVVSVDIKQCNRDTITVDIEPDHEMLMREAGAPPDCTHDWTAAGEGGCNENPGVWATGGTSMLFRTHCRTCGLQRIEETTGSQRNPGEHDTVSYEMPDEDQVTRWRESGAMEEAEAEDGE